MPSRKASLTAVSRTVSSTQTDQRQSSFLRESESEFCVVLLFTPAHGLRRIICGDCSARTNRTLRYRTRKATLTLPRIRILQVGDLHLPTAATTARSVDQKDRTFSVELRNVMSHQPIKVVFKKLYGLLETTTINGMLFMGDMTDYGKIAGYTSGVRYIANALQIGQGRRHQSLFAGIVPGNHDIDRELAKAPSMMAKFAPLNGALAQAGFGPLPVGRPISHAISVDSAECHIVLMNSCWGCGALEYIPEEFRQSVGAAIVAALAGGDTKVVKAYYDRQFDTPAFSDASIAELLDLTTKLSSDKLLVVVAHHNLLPQRLTRIAPYTELVNSGAMRASLMEARRPPPCQR